MFARTTPCKKLALFYMRRDIKLFKLRGRLQNSKTMQTAEVWSDNQAKRRPNTMLPDIAYAAVASAAQPLQLSKVVLKAGVLDEYIPSTAYDTACTSNT